MRTPRVIEDSVGTDDDWRLWCRLCAKEDAQNNINVLFVKEEQVGSRTVALAGNKLNVNDLNLSDAVRKYFGVNIAINDELPQMLCTECFSRVTSLANFSERVSNVQQMFSDLQNSQANTKLYLQSMRLKYGVLNEQLEHMEMQQLLPEVHYVESKPKINDLEEVIFDPKTTDKNPLEPICTELKKEIVLGEEKETTKDDVEKNYVFNDKNFVYESKTESDDSDDEDFAPPEKSNIIEKQAKSMKKKRKKEKDINQSRKQPCRTKRKQISNKNDSDTDSSDFDSTQNDSKYVCIECSQRFKYAKIYVNHMKRKHSQIVDIPLEEFRCDECASVFPDKRKLKAHEQLHLPIESRRVESCAYCDKKFTSKHTVRMHIKFVHNQERPYVCDECGEGMCTKVSLKEHKALLHSDNPLFVCEVCKKAFKNNTGLKKHRETHDPNKHKCTECGLELNSRATLRQHMVCHSDEMKYKCDYCGRGFKRSKTMKNHRILHTGLRPYSCEFCGRTFPTSVNCRTHKTLAHRKELAILEGKPM